MAPVMWRRFPPISGVTWRWAGQLTIRGCARRRSKLSRSAIVRPVISRPNTGPRKSTRPPSRCRVSLPIWRRARKGAEYPHSGYLAVVRNHSLTIHRHRKFARFLDHRGAVAPVIDGMLRALAERQCRMLAVSAMIQAIDDRSEQGASDVR